MASVSFRLSPLPSSTTSQIDISPPPTIPHTTRHLWETKHSRFGSRVLQQKIFVWQFCPKCVCLLLSVGKIALLVCWGSVVCVCSVSLCLFVCFLGGFCYPPASFHFPPAQPRRPPLLAAFSAPHVISEKSNTPISEAEFCNRRASFCNFGRKVLLLLLVCWSLCLFFFWWLLLASPLPSLPSTTTSQIDISPPPTIPHTTRHLWETKHSRFGSRVLQQKIFVWQFCPKCVCLLLSVGKIALLVCWGSVVCVCSVSLISEKSNSPVSEAEFCNRRASFCNFGRKVLLLLLVCLSLCFFFLVASVSLPTPFTSLHHNLADWHLPSSHHPPHHTSSLRNQTLPFRKPGFAREDLRLASLSEIVLLLLLLLFCLLLSVGKIALLACWGSVVSVCCLSLCLVVCFLGGFC